MVFVNVLFMVVDVCTVVLSPVTLALAAAIQVNFDPAVLLRGILTDVPEQIVFELTLVMNV